VSGTKKEGGFLRDAMGSRSEIIRRGEVFRIGEGDNFTSTCRKESFPTECMKREKGGMKCTDSGSEEKVKTRGGRRKKKQTYEVIRRATSQRLTIRKNRKKN